MVTAKARAKNLVRSAIRRAGVDVVRYPESNAEWKVAQLLNREGVRVVLDVGANRGQYATGLREHGYTGHIVSFEPVTEAFLKLQAASADDPQWDIVQCAIGEEPGHLTINVAANGAASSSLLPMLDVHREAAPEAEYVGTEEVEVRVLDEAAIVAGIGDRAVFLKVDVQGFEKSVFAGARKLLESGQVCGLQMELSFTQLYEGGMNWRYGFDLAEERGMSLMYLLPGFKALDGKLLQADGVFFRSASD